MRFYPRDKATNIKNQKILYFDSNQNIWKSILKTSGWNLCNKAIKKDVIDKTLKLLDTLPPIPRLNMAEDCLKTFLLTLTIKKGVFIPNALYVYYQDNLTSITKTRDNEKNYSSSQDYMTIINFLNQIPNLHSLHNKNKAKLQRFLFAESLILKAKSTERDNILTAPIAYIRSLKYHINPYALCRLFLYFITLGRIRP